MKHSGILAGSLLAGLPGGKLWSWSRLGRPVGLQLFTLFGVIEQDVPGTLRKVASIGYREIESAFSRLPGYYGMKPKEFAVLTKDSGLSWISHHVLGAPFVLPPNAKMPKGPDGKPMELPPMKNLRENGQELIDQAAEGGITYLVCAYTPTGSLDEIKRSIATLQATGEACKKAGLSLCYHNHDFEFHEVEGQRPYHMLLTEISPDLMQMELDLAWVTKAGEDPLELFRRHPGRFPLWHVKDIAKDLQTLEPVGSGIIDFPKIFAQADQAGMKHFFVEHDMPADAFASISSSIHYLNGITR